MVLLALAAALVATCLNRMMTPSMAVADVQLPSGKQQPQTGSQLLRLPQAGSQLLRLPQTGSQLLWLPQTMRRPPLCLPLGRVRGQ